MPAKKPAKRKPAKKAHARATICTSDGYKFYVQSSGRVTDTANGRNSDMSWPSVASFKRSMGDEGYRKC
jgi:hypothetical protein